MEGDRLPPYDIDAEEAALGSLLVDPEAILKVASFLEPGDFYREKNRWAYEAALALSERKEAINQITLAAELARLERLEAAGGAAYLSYLVSQLPTSLHVEYYAQIVRRLSMMRQLIRTAREIEAIGYESPPQVDEALSRAEEALFRLRRGERRWDFVPLREVLGQYLEESGFARRPGEGYLPHIPTSFVDLDRLLGGMQRANMIVLAARPSMGKTSLALNIARNVALDYQAQVAIFSLEMSKMDLAYRFLSMESGVDTQRVRLDQLTEEQRETVLDAAGLLSEAQIYIDDSAQLRDSDMRSKARRLHAEKEGLDLIIVDFIQLMRSGRPTNNPVQEMTEISHSIKALARELDVPVLAVSQLSRAVEQRDDKMPMLSDLRESGSIEQDADVVLFIYRDDYYFTKEKWEALGKGEYRKGVAQVKVAKHRNGPTGMVELYFSEKTVKFANLARVTP